MKKNEIFLLSSNFKLISKQTKIESKQKKHFTSRNKGGKKNLFQILQQIARRQGRGK
jgi:hypothetical protein